MDTCVYTFIRTITKRHTERLIGGIGERKSVRVAHHNKFTQGHHMFVMSYVKANT